MRGGHGNWMDPSPHRLFDFPVCLPVSVRTIKALYIRIQSQHISASTTFKTMIGIGWFTILKNAEVHLPAPVAAKRADHAEGIAF